MSGFVIVGAGHAGLRAALSARKAGFEGTITLVDSDPSWPSYERPPLSKWGEDGVEERPIVPAETVDAANLTFIHAEVQSFSAEEKTITLSSGETLGFDKLLLATGAEARALPGAMTLRSKADAEAIRAKAVTAQQALIIGAGFIGLELAASLRKLGVAVRVLEQAPRILARGATPEIAAIVQKRHESEGVEFLLGQTASDADLAQADIVVAGIGSSPSVTLAEQAGLAVENGILVDQFLRTSHADIFAAGDCCAAPLSDDQPTRLEAWTAAGQQGDIAGQNMAAPENLTPFSQTPWVWSDQYDCVLQSAGLQNADQTMVERVCGPDHHISFGVKDGRLAFAVGIAPGAKIAKDIRFAMKLIEAGCAVDISALADPTAALKAMLKR